MALTKTMPGIKGSRVAQTIGWVETPSVRIGDNGNGALVLIFPSSTVRRWNLQPGERMDVHYDRASHRAAIEFKKDGKCHLTTHGGKDNVLKMGFGAFIRDHLTGEIELPFRSDLTEIGPLLFFDLPGRRIPRGWKRAASARD